MTLDDSDCECDSFPKRTLEIGLTVLQRNRWQTSTKSAVSCFSDFISASPEMTILNFFLFIACTVLTTKVDKEPADMPEDVAIAEGYKIWDVEA